MSASSPRTPRRRPLSHRGVAISRFANDNANTTPPPPDDDKDDGDVGEVGESANGDTGDVADEEEAEVAGAIGVDVTIAANGGAVPT